MSDYVNSAHAILKNAIEELDRLGTPSTTSNTLTRTTTPAAVAPSTSSTLTSFSAAIQPSTSGLADRVQENFRRAFPGLCGRSGQKRNPSNDKDKAPKKMKLSNAPFFKPKETWTHYFCFLGHVNESYSPSKDELYHLQLAGLGKRKIVFPNKNAKHEEFVNVLGEECPKIKGGGGFELLQAFGGGGGKRKMEVIPPGKEGYTLAYLRNSVCVGQALTYVRPLQKDLDLSPVSVDYLGESGPTITCLNCGEEVLYGKLKQHQEDCSCGGQDDDNRMDTLHSVDLTNTDDDNGREYKADVDWTKKDNLDLPNNGDGNLSQKSGMVLSVDGSLAQLLEMFPDKSYREIQRKFAEAGSLDATITALLANNDDDDLMISVFDTSLQVSSDLESFRKHWLSDMEQPIIIDRHCSKPLREIFKLYKRGLNVRSVPNVEFKGEEGSDASGPTREYFHLSMTLLVSGDSSIHLFEGEDNHLLPIHCVESLDSLLFYYTGLMISHSFLHGGYPLVGLSKAAVAYIVTGSIDEAIPHLTISDIPDLEQREILEKVRDANTDEEFTELNADEGVLNVLTAAGFVNKLLSKTNRDAALEMSIIHCALTVRKLEMDDIRRGMEIISLASFLSNKKELWFSPHLFPRSNEVSVSAENLESKVVLHSSYKQDELDADQQLAFNWCKEYIQSLPAHSEDAHAPTTGRFLLFVFGSPLYPTQPIYVKFNREEKSLPDPESCLGILSLPVNAANFQDFKRKMDVTLSAQATGYGRF